MDGRNFSWRLWAFLAIGCACAFASDSAVVNETVAPKPTFVVQQTPTAADLPEYRNFSADFVSYVDAAVNKLMNCYNISGLSLAVIDRRQTNATTNNVVLKFTKGYGVKDLRTNAPVDENTKFAIGSVTKSFTGATFANLSARLNGTLDFDTLVSPILQKNFNTNLSNSDKQFDSYGNFRDLLAHRTAVIGSVGPLSTGSNLSIDEMVRAINTLPALPRKFDGGFRESFVYNNWMYGLVGALMADAAGGGGKTWKSLVRETIFEPWGIGATFLHDLVDGKDNFALPMYLYANTSGNGTDYEYYYKQNDLEWVQERLGTQEIFGPAGSIAASAEDMGE